MEEDEYYEIHSRNSERNLRLSALQNVGKPATSSLAKDSVEKKPTKTLLTPPSPPPRRLLNNARNAKALDFSPVRTVSSSEWPLCNESFLKNSVSIHAEDTTTGSGRPSMDSGISEKQSETDEKFMTRL
ncbi:hypothetical protein KIN20_018366 [Parelaphostrongylus tenuis]|uniref:Uncharacterized protein n=1 Tax=Parelaphostrongylus tenuis TaxID=148309 RepID=A0AAD5N3L1_PARTN|nr:hypothetical protein KIN20_018366 [Parelaphostrongylus tenuis]